MIILGTNSIKDTGYDVDNSLRFNDGSSDYLSRTNGGSPTSSSIFTFSCWIKKSQGVPSEHQVLFGNFDSTDNTGYFRFNDDATMRYFDKQGGSTRLNYTTPAVFRDVSAWYNLVINVDTSRSSGDRVRIFSNGTQLTTSVATDTSGNLGLLTATSSNGMTVGAVKRPPSPNYEYYYDGYMCEAVFIDGQALAPDQFGEFDQDSGIWKPINVSGLTFGNNGFYLDFENSGALGADVSGNSNNFTVNNLSAVDQSLDTCTNNACVWNPLRFWNRSGTLQKVSFDNGNLRAIFDDNGYNEYAFASIGVNTGKWFCEMKAEDITATGNTRIGVLNMDYTGTGNPGDQSTSVSYLADGQKRVGGSNSSYGASYANGDIIGIALDVTNNTVTFYKNGSSQGSISITANTLYTFYSEDYASGGNKEISANFISPAYAISSGNADGNGYGNFEYAVPSGYLSLCTKNLSEALS